MLQPATRDEIVAYLEGVPSASTAWVDAFYSANFSLEVIEKMIQVMSTDANSPLRKAEESMVGKEMMKINVQRGAMASAAYTGGKMVVKCRVVLNSSEQTRVCKVVAGFVQPLFDTRGVFGKSGHAVMNAVRRLLTAYVTSKVPTGASIVEVGPDVKNWLLSPTPSQWAGRAMSSYTAARPVKGPRDSVRVQWQSLADAVCVAKRGLFSEDVKMKARLLKESYDIMFLNSDIQAGASTGEYILSFDSNYDIKFSDMPVAMAACGARAWYGVMLRAKGLTRTTRLTEGKLQTMGTTYRVDWSEGRIDFRHPECNAFGYSHDVYQYMRYEECNGFVWNAQDYHYVYSKGPETTDELLFFNVVRVPKVFRMQEPRYVENPHAGLVKLTSIWSVGDEVSGVPTSFERVVFFVDSLNFSKVLEKRRALDHKGMLTTTVALVRSTNVRMWLHGTPVSANKRIESKLIAATAVVIETLANEARLDANYCFERAMYEYNVNLPRSSWLRSCLEAVVDLQYVTGKIVGPVLRMWQSMRGAVIDAAIGSIGKIRVGAEAVEPHIKLGGAVEEVMDYPATKSSQSLCNCGEVAELAMALKLAVGNEKVLLRDYFFKLKKDNRVCEYCVPQFTSIKVVQEECDSESKDSGIGSSINTEDDVTTAVVESGSDRDVDVGEKIDESTIESDDEDNCVEEVGASWRSEESLGTPESKSMLEFVNLENYLVQSELRELRVDASRIFSRGPVTTKLLKEFATSRTKHVVLEFMAGRCVRTYGPDIGSVGAVYDLDKNVIVPVQGKLGGLFSPGLNGFFYSCNRLKIWNAPDIISAVDYALSYGRVASLRKKMKVTLGVPGAGKTYGMMKKLSELFLEFGEISVLVLAVTKKSVLAAKKYAKQFGIDEAFIDNRIMTLDSYLMHKKAKTTELLCVDEFPMVHIGKVDAAASISGATSVRLFGDAKQIPYDPFCAEFDMRYARLGGSVLEKNVSFLPMTHRLKSDICAMWLDQYPSIYPCDCCAVDDKDRISCDYEKIRDVSALRYDGRTRFHTYKQDERDDLKTFMGIPGSVEELRALDVGGLSTVHEDQGSTHKSVVTVRLSVDYDKNASPRNPSLYNRERYVLTDTTRHTDFYKYYTMAEEDDLVMKRIRLSRDEERKRLVRERKPLINMNVIDML